MAVMSVLARIGRLAWRFRSSRKGFAVLWLLIVVFLGRAAVRAYAEYGDVSPAFHGVPFVIAVAVLTVRSGITPVKWYYLLRAHGSSLRFTTVSRAFYLSQLSSYIPGGIWKHLDMGYRAAEEGEEIDAAMHSVVFVQGMTVAAALFYAAAVAALVLRPWSPLFVASAVAVLLVAVVSADLLERMKGGLETVFDVDVPSYTPSKKTLAGLFLLSLFIWVLNGIFFYFLTAAFADVGVSLFLPLSGIIAASWAAGFLVLILPGGLGVREGVMVYLLARLVALPEALAVAAAARVLFLAADVAMALLFSSTRLINGQMSRPVVSSVSRWWRMVSWKSVMCGSVSGNRAWLQE
ncbi:MAG: lysylphosphatidylglycerol synthase domain-containing protein [Candidatus Nanohaloarchaea archaeon]